MKVFGKSPFTVNSILDQPLSDYLDLKVYAYWKDDSDDGEGGYNDDGTEVTVLFQDENSETFTKTAVFGELLPSITKPKLQGSNFLGYFTEKNGLGIKYYNKSCEPLKILDVKELKLYGYWEKIEYTTVFVIDEVKQEVYSNYGDYINAPIVSDKTGYEFIGWFTTPDGKGAAWNFTNDIITQDLYLYAHFLPLSFKVLIEQEGIGMVELDVFWGKSMPQTLKPTRQGHQFGGYYSAPGGGGKMYYDQDMQSASVWDMHFKCRVVSLLAGNWRF